MLILSQDRQRVINFKDITELYVSYIDDDSTIYCDTNNDNEIALGFYKDKERCKEVLIEIVEHYNKVEKSRLYARSGYTPNITGNFTYYMPEE